MSNKYYKHPTKSMFAMIMSEIASMNVVNSEQLECRLEVFRSLDIYENSVAHYDTLENVLKEIKRLLECVDRFVVDNEQEKLYSQALFGGCIKYREYILDDCLKIQCGFLYDSNWDVNNIDTIWIARIFKTTDGWVLYYTTAIGYRMRGNIPEKYRHVV